MTLHPVDAVWVEQKLVVGGKIVEYRHLPLTDYDQFLFLKRVEPAHENVGIRAALELKVADCHVRDRFVQKIAARG